MMKVALALVLYVATLVVSAAPVKHIVKELVNEGA